IWNIFVYDIPRIILSVSVSEFVQSKLWLNFLLIPVRFCISVVTLLPIVTKLSPNPRIIPTYLTFYLILIILWSVDDPIRFLVPLVPFFCLFFIVGVNLCLTRISRLLPKLTTGNLKALL
ncbi:MAG: hypothetical protein AB1489_42990, partial [Acidobacteriota bacterium]